MELQNVSLKVKLLYFEGKTKISVVKFRWDQKINVWKSIAKTFLFTNRQKSSSEIETRNIGPGGQDFEDDSKYPLSITYCQT